MVYTLITAMVALAYLVLLPLAGTTATKIILSPILSELGIAHLNVGNWLGVLMTVAVMGTLASIVFEVINLWSTTYAPHQWIAVLLCWGRDGLTLLAVGSLLYLVIVPFLGSVKALTIVAGVVTLRAIDKQWDWRESEQRFYNRHFSEHNRIKASWEVEEVQWWYGVKGLFRWGAYNLVDTQERKTKVVLGSPGSGKTLFAKAMLLPGILRMVGSGLPARAFIQDCKQEFLPILSAAKVQYFILNPFDTRAAKIDLSEEVKNVAQCQVVAQILCGSYAEGNYFDQTAQLILSSLLYTLVLAKQHGIIKTWSLREIILFAEQPQLLNKLCLQFPETRNAMNVIALPLKETGGTFELSKAGRDVMSTLQSKLGKLRSIAALWDSIATTVSLRAWASGSSVLHMGIDENYLPQTRTVCRLVLELAIPYILGKPENKEYTHFFFEEFAASIPPRIPDLIRTGRSKGLILTIIYQSSPDVLSQYLKTGEREETVNAILDMAEYVAVFRCGRETAEAMSTMIGEREYVNTTHSINAKNETSTTASLARRSPLSAQDLMNLENPSPATGLSGYFFCPGEGYADGWHYTSIPWDTLMRLQIEPDATTPAYNPIAEDSPAFSLRPFSQEELDRFFGGRPTKS